MKRYSKILTKGSCCKMEIGGYIEFEKYNRPMLHENAIKLNCARNALAYLIEVKKIKAIAMPRYICDSCESILEKYNVHVSYYAIGLNFKPEVVKLKKDEWLYVINYYGQLTNEYIKELKKMYGNIIIDNTQAYFQKPVDEVDTLYTCRKFFGVADGAILYTDKILKRDTPRDESYDRMHFILGRFEKNASEYYSEYVSNECFFRNEPIKKMSRLTENLLHGIDYGEVKRRRTVNFSYMHERLRELNILNLTVPEGAFMYPLYIKKGMKIRSEMQKRNIYVPTLWPSVIKNCNENEMEYNMAKDILPLPIDQRYGKKELNIIIDSITQIIHKLGIKINNNFVKIC